MAITRIIASESVAQVYLMHIIQGRTGHMHLGKSKRVSDKQQMKVSKKFTGPKDPFVGSYVIFVLHTPCYYI